MADATHSNIPAASATPKALLGQSIQSWDDLFQERVPLAGLVTMNWQTHHRPGIGAGRTNGFLAPLNPFAFTLPPSAALHNVPSNELLLTATNIPTRGLQPVTVPRDRQRDRLTKSDPQPHAFHLLRHREPIHRRSKTVEIVVDKEAPKRPPSSRRVLPPLAITVATQEISDSDLEVVAEETQPLEGEDESEDSSSSEEDDEVSVLTLLYTR